MAETTVPQETKPSLEKEEAMKNAMTGAFGDKVRDIQIKRERRLFATVSPDDLIPVMKKLHDDFSMLHLSSITGSDVGDKLDALYHLFDDRTLLTIRVSAPKAAPSIPTVSEIFPAGVFYEKELESMLGFTVVGLPPGRKYPVFDDWDGAVFPLRKDFVPPPDPDTVKG
ncbi:MAG: NADH-quinone oxidoreductase subunit C [Spirochaetes bacterium]|nr:NADH-quinone oxidoreductase subunit C [Spirochaetota bacterium]